MTGVEPDQQRAETLERWRRAAVGWGRRADTVRDFGMPVSAWLVDQLDLQPGHVVLELAAGPGDTGFMAAELVRPGGRLICSDNSEPMLEIARERAAEQGIENVEFRLLELEWIDMGAASVDAVLCRWGLMFPPDPGAALQDVRRVLRPGGRCALAVWDAPELNPWATVPTRALLEAGLIEPPDPDAPGMFTLAQPGRLSGLLESAGFTEVRVESAEVVGSWPDVAGYLDQMIDLNVSLAESLAGLGPESQERLRARIEELCAPFQDSQGALRMPGRSIVASASA